MQDGPPLEADGAREIGIELTENGGDLYDGPVRIRPRETPERPSQSLDSLTQKRKDPGRTSP